MSLVEVREAVPAAHARQIGILATDLSADAIEAARKGFHPPVAGATRSPARLTRFLVAHGDDDLINRALRDTARFAQHDAILDPPPSVGQRMLPR